ncbi:MAG: YceI family protein, partial [Proteobacteria bacterium]|nr:YceI family protein [Pseudomonadota bacterium]
MKKLFILLLLLTGLVAVPGTLRAADYTIDTAKAHAFVQFKISHLGYSWLLGRFNTFEGDFSFDETKPEASKVNVTIDVASVDTNHAERDKHLRGKDFFEVKKYPKATFVSKSFKVTGKASAVMTGDFTLHGVTREVEIDVDRIGGGNDPWGGYRQGFEGKTT